MRKRLLRSRSGFEKPESREEAIMQNILGASNVLEPSESNIEEILKSILYNTPYTKEAEFEIEKILLAIKNNGTYDGEGESRDMKILIAILNDLDYTEEAESRIEELFIEWLHQRSKVKVLEGVPPLTFVAKGEPLINYEISGNTVQSGTPSPDNPIQPSECGDLETTGEHAGQYKIPISSASTTTPVYLGEVETTRRIKKHELTGNEPFVKNDSQSTNYLYYAQRVSVLPRSKDKTPVICNELPEKNDAPQTVIGINANNTFGVVYFNFGAEVMNSQPSRNTVTGLKEYLAAQYAAGTPVTVYYVLETPETGIVNEPIRKIGEYADTVSMEQAGVEIPTVSGSNTLDVDTTLKPSNIYIEYK